MTSGKNAGGGKAAALLAEARKAHGTGDNATALNAVSQAIAQAPSAEAWDLKGDILLALGQVPAATEAYGRAVDLQPDHAGYVHDLGRSLLHAGRPAEAEGILVRAAALKPDAWDILCDLGTALLEQGFAARALEALTKAVTANPRAGLAHYSRGTALRELGRLDDAEKAYATALQVMPNLLPATLALATLLGDRGRLAEAEALFASVEAAAADFPPFHQAKALVMLRYGRLREGFRGYAWRFKQSPHSLQARPFTHALWQGQDLRRCDLLIWTEQGLGDEILSAGMFPEVIAAAQSCTIECSERAAPLFRRSFKDAMVVPRRDPADPKASRPFDYQIAALSLGGLVRPEFARFPAHRGYLQADPATTAALRQRYRAQFPGRRIVGISWESTARHGPHKRLPLESWLPILRVPELAFVSLQYGIGADDPEIARLGPGANLFVDGAVDAVKSLDDSAAQMAAMDLVITISNTTAHLAGALGVPVWTLLADGPGCFWYWFRDRADSPWYPSMRIFRQSTPGAWPEVVNRVAQALVEMQPPGRL